MPRFQVRVKAPDEALILLSDDLAPEDAVKFVQAAIRLLLIQGPGWALEFRVVNDP